jgi:hypothetical protein
MPDTTSLFATSVISKPIVQPMSQKNFKPAQIPGGFTP